MNEQEQEEVFAFVVGIVIHAMKSAVPPVTKDVLRREADEGRLPRLVSGFATSIHKAIEWGLPQIGYDLTDDELKRLAAAVVGTIFAETGFPRGDAESLALNSLRYLETFDASDEEIQEAIARTAVEMGVPILPTTSGAPVLDAAGELLGRFIES